MGAAEAEDKYIKQTGGKGQYGHVKLNIKPMEPLEEGAKIPKNVYRYDDFEFVNSIKGGVIPQEFIPAVEKGVHEAMDRGIVAGFPMVNVSCELTYGSYHDVDSSEIAYKIAASQAFQEAAKARPARHPRTDHETRSAFPGEIHGRHHRQHLCKARTNRRMTSAARQSPPRQSPAVRDVRLHHGTAFHDSGQGSATMEFDHYEVVPPNVEKEIVTERGTKS